MCQKLIKDRWVATGVSWDSLGKSIAEANVESVFKFTAKTTTTTTKNFNNQV